jgi:hypothetical protein
VVASVAFLAKVFEEIVLSILIMSNEGGIEIACNYNDVRVL